MEGQILCRHLARAGLADVDASLSSSPWMRGAPPKGILATDGAGFLSTGKLWLLPRPLLRAGFGSSRDPQIPRVYCLPAGGWRPRLASHGSTGRNWSREVGADVVSAALGANIFAGRHENTFFGQMAKNDNLYLSVRFDF